MKSKFPTHAGLTPYDNAADGGSPRGAFQIFAERKYGGQGIGVQTYAGSFHSLEEAQTYACALFDANPGYYKGFEWVQVADMFHGGVWNLDTSEAQGEWEQVEGEDTFEQPRIDVLHLKLRAAFQRIDVDSEEPTDEDFDAFVEAAAKHPEHACHSAATEYLKLEKEEAGQ